MGLSKTCLQPSQCRQPISLELDIASYRHANFSVQDYSFGFLNLWTEHSAIMHADVSTDSPIVVQNAYEVTEMIMMKRLY